MLLHYDFFRKGSYPGNFSSLIISFHIQFKRKTYEKLFTSCWRLENATKCKPVACVGYRIVLKLWCPWNQEGPSETVWISLLLSYFHLYCGDKLFSPSRSKGRYNLFLSQYFFSYKANFWRIEWLFFLQIFLLPSFLPPSPPSSAKDLSHS